MGLENLFQRSIHVQCISAYRLQLNFFCAGLIVVPTLSDNPAPKSTLWQAGLVREQWEQKDC